MSNIADSNNPPPPLPPTTIPSIVDTLDPDLAAAYRAGNPTIIQAVNAGMTTSQMIVNEVIRMGGGMTGLPPAVQTMVSERQKEMAEQAEAENARLKALAAGVVGLGLMGSNIAKGGDYYGESSGSTSSSARLDGGQFSAMSIEQMQQVDFNTYQKMSEPEKKQFNNEAMNKAKDERTTAEKGINDIIDKMQADGRSGKDIQDVILAAQGYKAEDDLSSDVGQQRQKDRIATLSPELQKYAVPMGKYKVAEQLATDAMASVVAGRIGNDQHRHGQTMDGINKTADAKKKNDEAKGPAHGPAHGRKYAAPTHADTEDDARAKIEAGLQDGYYSTRDSNSVVAYDGWEELYNSRHKAAPVDGLAAKSEIQADVADASPSTQRHTISALPLSAAGMLQPEGVVVASAEPQAPTAGPELEPEQQRLRRSAPTQGMSA